MRELPIIELRVRDFGEQLHGTIMAHHEEIEAYIRDGVEAAMRELPKTIIADVAQEASKQIHEQIRAYFSYGAGSRAIRLAVAQALAPIAELLAQGLPFDVDSEETH